MIFNYSEGASAEAFAEDLAAELTMAAYLVTLRYCATQKWLDLQLELWRALSAALASSGIAVSTRREASYSALHAEDFWAELAYVAYGIALPYGCPRSFLDLELELYQTLRRTAECVETDSLGH